MSKVLIIDDDKKHSELLQAYFKRFGISLVCAHDASGSRRISAVAKSEPDAGSSASNPASLRSLFSGRWITCAPGARACSPAAT